MKDSKKSPEDQKALAERVKKALATPGLRSELLAEKAVRDMERKGLKASRQFKQFTTGSKTPKKKRDEAEEEIRSVVEFAEALAKPIDDEDIEALETSEPPLENPTEAIVTPPNHAPQALDVLESSEPEIEIAVEVKTQPVDDPMELWRPKGSDIYPEVNKGMASYRLKEGQVVAGSGAEIPESEKTEKIKLPKGFLRK